LPENALDHADGNPIDLGDLETVIPYFTKVRMCANFDTGISGLTCSSGFTGVATPSTSSRGAGGRREVASTRGFRADCSAEGSGFETDGPVTCRFGAKSASAAWRAHRRVSAVVAIEGKHNV